jgi:hypothetical protein
MASRHDDKRTKLHKRLLLNYEDNRETLTHATTIEAEKRPKNSTTDTKTQRVHTGSNKKFAT